MVDINAGVGTLRYYAGWSDKIHGKTIEVGAITNKDVLHID